MDRHDLDALTSWFGAYCRRYYTGVPEDDRNIAIKEEHTGRVRDFSGRIALDEEFAPGDLLLAEAIGICHDVGRFEQYRRYRTYRDADSENHALLGVRELKGEGALEHLPPVEQKIIMQAVSLHNVFALPAGLGPVAGRQARLIRDADKLDIWRVFLEYYRSEEGERASAVSLGFPDLPVCSPGPLAALARGEMVRLDALVTLADFKLLQISWVFDLNFSASCRLAGENGDLAGIAATLPAQPGVREVVDAALALLARRASSPSGEGRATPT